MIHSFIDFWLDVKQDSGYEEVRKGYIIIELNHRASAADAAAALHQLTCKG